MKPVETVERRVEQAGEFSSADLFMRKLLRISHTAKTTRTSEAEAHRRFQFALVISGIRCLITYLLIPVLFPLLSLAKILAAPIGIALCLIAVISGVSSLRRFWSSNHRYRWMYTWFIAAVFVVLAIAMVSDFVRLGEVL